MKITDYGLDD